MRTADLAAVAVVCALLGPSRGVAAAPDSPRVALRGSAEDEVFDAYKKVAARERTSRGAPTSAAGFDAVDAMRKRIESLQADLSDVTLQNKDLLRENELLKSSFGVLSSAEDGERSLRTRVAAMEEELRLKNKEVFSLRRENAALLENRDATLGRRTKAYEDENARLRDELLSRAKADGARIDGAIAAYEKRIAVLEGHLDALTDGQWSLIKERDGEDTAETKKVLADIRRERGEAEAVAGRIAALERAYADRREGVDVKPMADGERAELFVRLGKAYVAAGRYPQALESFLRAEQTGSAPDETYYFLGLLYQQTQGDKAKALEALRRYLFRAPQGDHASKAETMIGVIAAGR